MVATETKYLSAAETAKLVRSALKQSFPGVTFSVRSRKYSGGASIDVSWTDGPRTPEVEAIAKRYEGADFDGMIDLKYSKSHYLRPDGTTLVEYNPGTQSSMGTDPGLDNRHLAAIMPADVQRVHFGADFIFCSRDISNYDAKLADALAWCYANLHIEEPVTNNPNADRFGNEWINNIARRMVQGQAVGESWEATFKRRYN